LKLTAIRCRLIHGVGATLAGLATYMRSVSPDEGISIDDDAV
jgi:hypothetical protein